MTPPRAWHPFADRARRRSSPRSRPTLGRSLRVIAFTFLLALSATAAPSANHGFPPVPPPTPVKAQPEEGCLRDVDPAGSGFSVGELSQAASLYRTENRTVDIHRGTLLSAIALAKAYNFTLEVTNVSNFTSERIEVCAFDSLASVEGREALLGDLVGRGKGPLHLGGARLLTVFQTTTVQNVTLASEIAFAAISLKGSGATVKLDDVMTFQRESRTTRTLERLVNLTDEQLLLEIALRGDAEERARGGRAPNATGPDAPREARADAVEEAGREAKAALARDGDESGRPRKGGLKRRGPIGGWPPWVAPGARAQGRRLRSAWLRAPQMRVPVMGRRLSALLTKATPVRTMPSSRWRKWSAGLTWTPIASRTPGATNPTSVTRR